MISPCALPACVLIATRWARAMTPSWRSGTLGTFMPDHNAQATQPADASGIRQIPERRDLFGYNCSAPCSHGQ